MVYSDRDKQFKFDYRPVIALYAIFCVWQGLAWFMDPEERYTAAAFHTMSEWAQAVGLNVHHWGVPMFVAGFLILGGMIAKVWQVRWAGYLIAMLTFLSVADSIRRSGIIFPEASQSGFRTYVFVGVLPIVLAVVAQYHAFERREKRAAP